MYEMGQRRVGFVFILLLFHVLVALLPRPLHVLSASVGQDRDANGSTISTRANEEITVDRHGGSGGGHGGGRGRGGGGGWHAGWYGAIAGGNTQSTRNGNKNHHHGRNCGTFISTDYCPLFSPVLTSFVFVLL